MLIEPPSDGGAVDGYPEFAEKRAQHLIPATPAADTHGIGRVLVIEAEPSISKLLRIIRENDGHEVLVAEDGSRGVATATRRSPEAIILDVMMPFMDGFAVLEALREVERTVSIPVILSAIQSESVEERCYRLGAQAFVRKPFDARTTRKGISSGPRSPRPIATTRRATPRRARCNPPNRTTSRVKASMFVSSRRARTPGRAQDRRNSHRH